MDALLTLDKEGSPCPAPRRRGQPSRYNTALRAAICRDIASGVPVHKAFLCNGISSRTGFNWTRYRPEFADAVAAARDQFQRGTRSTGSIRHLAD